MFSYVVLTESLIYISSIMILLTHIIKLSQTIKIVNIRIVKNEKKTSILKVAKIGQYTYVISYKNGMYNYK